MAITINGTGTITGISAGGLPDGSVTAADIESSLDLTGKTVTLPSGTGGKILQVVQATKTDTATTTSTSFGDVSGLSVSITPANSSNKILVLMQLGSIGNRTNTVLFNLVRNATNIAQPSSGSQAASLNQFPGGGSTNAAMGGASIIWLDSPATTSSTTYKVQWRVDNGTGYLNRHPANTNYNSVSTITVMEVAA